MEAAGAEAAGAGPRRFRPCPGRSRECPAPVVVSRRLTCGGVELVCLASFLFALVDMGRVRAITTPQGWHAFRRRAEGEDVRWEGVLDAIGEMARPCARRGAGGWRRGETWGADWDMTASTSGRHVDMGIYRETRPRSDGGGEERTE